MTPDPQVIAELIDLLNNGVTLVTLVLAATSGLRKREVTGEVIAIHDHHVDALIAGELIELPRRDIAAVRAA